MNQENRTYSISPEVFAQFPGYVRGVVIATGVKNSPSPPELVELLRDAEESVRSSVNADKIAEHPRMASWREAYRAFGAKPAKFRPSMEAMARRVIKGDQLPSIHSLVDIGNIVSLRRLVPAGGHAIDVVTGNIELRPATGTEEFVPFGSEETEHPSQGEIIFVEGTTVLTRRWTWRQANHTLVTLDTAALEFNVDGLPPVEPAEVEEACAEIAQMIQRFCGGQTRMETLSDSNPVIGLD